MSSITTTTTVLWLIIWMRHSRKPHDEKQSSVLHDEHHETHPFEPSTPLAIIGLLHTTHHHRVAAGAVLALRPAFRSRLLVSGLDSRPTLRVDKARMHYIYIPPNLAWFFDSNSLQFLEHRLRCMQPARPALHLSTDTHSGALSLALSC